MVEFDELQELLGEPDWWIPTGLSSDDRMALRSYAGGTEPGLRCVVRLETIRRDAGVPMGTWLPFYLDSVEEDGVRLIHPVDQETMLWFMLDLVETAASLYDWRQRH